MYEIHKESFGSFVAALRKEKGMTQKDLADRLYISNKAVSKWETGTTLPDTALLMPLAEVLGVTVTELLKCQRLPREESRQTEELVQAVINLSEEGQRKYFPDRWKRGTQLLLCAIAGILEIFLLLQLEYSLEELSLALFTMMSLMAVFGTYFCVFARERLPDYYDSNRISAFSDGILRMNVPGVYFNNSNWPHIVRAGQLWAMFGLAGAPAVYFLLRKLFPQFTGILWVWVILLIALGSLFIPMMVVGRKYEYEAGTAPASHVRRRDWLWIAATLVLVLALAGGMSVSGLASSGSGRILGWSEGKSLDSWNASYVLLQGYRQRTVNIKDEPATLHISAVTEEGSFTLLVTDSRGQILFEEEYTAFMTLNIPIPGKVQVRIIGEDLRGSFSMTW